MIRRIIRKLEKIYYLYIKHDAVSYARHLGVRVGEKCKILTDPQIAFGTEPWLIKLGNHVEVTYGAQFLSHEGGVWCIRGIDQKCEKMDYFAPTVVGDNVMIGVHSLIMPGVHIGNNVIIAGHCVVTKDIPDGMVACGVPARVIMTTEEYAEKCKSNMLPYDKDKYGRNKKAYLQELLMKE